MTCKQLHPFIVDLARGAIDAAAIEAQIARHVRGCQQCRSLLERERIMSAALRRVAHADSIPPIDPERERQLIAAFDDVSARPRTSLSWRPFWIPAVATAFLICAVAVGWRIPGWPPAKHSAPTEPIAAGPQRPSPRMSTPPSPEQTGAVASAETTSRPIVRSAPRRSRVSQPADPLEATVANVAYLTWPGAAAGPPLESGTLMTVDLPVSILPALGLWPPPSAQSTVPVEILVGQDGFARAFRVVE